MPEFKELDELLPAEADAPDPDDEFDALNEIDLLDTEDVIVTEEEPPPLGMSWAFDMAIGRYMRGAGREPTRTNGIPTLRYWVEKVLSTDRGAHPIYPSDFGVDDPHELIGQPVSPSLVTTVERKVIDALTVHPRIEDAIDFTVDYDPDEEFIEVAFTVVLDSGETFDVERRF